MCKALGWVGVGVKPIRACLCLWSQRPSLCCGAPPQGLDYQPGPEPGTLHEHGPEGADADAHVWSKAASLMVLFGSGRLSPHQSASL